jgi:hypothetical protein
MAHKQHSYTYQGGRVDIDGWYRIRLMRDDGRLVKVGKSRYKELKREGRIMEDKIQEEPGENISQ